MLLMYALINVSSVVGGAFALLGLGVSITTKNRKNTKVFAAMAGVLLVTGAMSYPSLVEYDKNTKQRIIDQRNERIEKCHALSSMEDRIVCRVEASR